jgi:hypothetical protein
MNRKLILLFFTSISWVFLNAQIQEGFDSDYFLFIDHEQQIPVIFLNDSTAYKGYDFKEFDVSLELHGVPISDLRALKINEETYIVDRGCGPVFKYEKDSLIRIDKSYRHRNQYGASIFTYNNKIYFFGGYGEFTDKNIVIYFDETSKEWFELNIKTSLKPEPRVPLNSLLLNTKLYTWGGISKSDNVYAEIVDDSTIWILDLEKNSWTKSNNVQQLIDPLRRFNLSFQIESKLFKLTNDALFEIDLSQNKVTEYEFSIPNISNCIYDPYAKNVIMVKGKLENTNEKILVKSLDELTSKVVNTKPFIIDSKSNNVLSYIYGTLFLVFGFITIKYFRKRVKQEKLIFFNKKESVFLYEDKSLHLDSEIHKLLVFLVEHQNEFVQLESINEIFTNSNIQESYVTINKRRDTAVKKLLFKLGTLLNKPEDEILLERKNINDKRVKEVKLGIKIIT